MNKKILSLLLAFAISSTVYGETKEDETYKTYPYGVTKYAPPQLIKIRPEDKISQYRPRVRIWQGMPHMEVSDGGRLWATWTISTSKSAKPPYFHDMQTIVATSLDDGSTWAEFFAFDPSLLLDAGSANSMLWKDKDGNIRLTLTRIMLLDKENKNNPDNRSVWEFTAKDSDSKDPRWSKPKYITNYNASSVKPTYLSNGTLIRPMDDFFDMQNPKKTRFLIEDQETGKELFISEAKVEDIGLAPSDQMVLEKKDGTLFSFVRTKDAGLRYITSKNMGKTWKDEGYFFKGFGVDIKSALVRVPSGEVLFIANDPQKEKSPNAISSPDINKSNLTAFLSLDDGKTFPYKLVLDERQNVSYPSVSFSKDGFIYVCYDRGRDKIAQQEILFAKITVDDIKAGHIVNGKSKFKQIISNLNSVGGGIKKEGEPL